jgi:hypothetical protein
VGSALVPAGCVVCGCVFAAGSVSNVASYICIRALFRLVSLSYIGPLHLATGYLLVLPSKIWLCYVCPAEAVVDSLERMVGGCLSHPLKRGVMGGGVGGIVTPGSLQTPKTFRIGCLHCSRLL